MDISVYPEDHDGPFPNFRQPIVIGHFSLTGDREFVKGMSGLQYLHPRKDSRVKLNLDHNLHLAVKPHQKKDTEKISNLLRGVLSHRNRFAVGDKLSSLNTDIVCFRYAFKWDSYTSLNIYFQRPSDHHHVQPLREAG